jgi:NAD(P)H-quinone oxidoreductase subunit 4
MIFLGLASSDSYTSIFKVVVVVLSAVGVILTPIYLLSMLREVFYGQENPELAELSLWDAKPREVFIAACLLLPVIGIGLYPKLLTQTYDVTTVQVAMRARTAVSTVAQEQTAVLSEAAIAPLAIAPELPTVTSNRFLGFVP